MLLHLERKLQICSCFSLSYHVLINQSPLLTGMDQEETETASLEEVLDDKMRVGYYQTYLAAVAQAIRYIIIDAYPSRPFCLNNFFIKGSGL